MEREHVVEKAWSWDRSCWIGNQTEPSPLACNDSETRVTQPEGSLVVWCAEWDVIKMQVSLLWNTVRHSQEDWMPQCFPLTQTLLLIILFTFDWLDCEALCKLFFLDRTIQIAILLWLYNTCTTYSWTPSVKLCFLKLKTLFPCRFSLSECM